MNEKIRENAQDVLLAMHDEQCMDLCKTCRYAVFDFDYSGLRYDMDCKKGDESFWNDDEEAADCENYKLYKGET